MEWSFILDILLYFSVYLVKLIMNCILFFIVLILINKISIYVVLQSSNLRGIFILCMERLSRTSLIVLLVNMYIDVSITSSRYATLINSSNRTSMIDVLIQMCYSTFSQHVHSNSASAIASSIVVVVQP